MWISRPLIPVLFLAAVLSHPHGKSGAGRPDGRPPARLASSEVFSAPDIASTDFDHGNSAPFKTSNGSVKGSADITIIDDPTGAFRGKVAAFLFARTRPASAPDVDRALRVTKTTRHGETVFVRGHVMIPTPEPTMRTAMRKLIYVQTDEPVGSFCVIRVNGQRLFAEVTGTKSAARVLKLGDFRFDTKYSIEVQITVNTAPGTPDGILRVWKDGTLAIEVNDVNWINARSRGAAFSRFLFGQQTQGTKRSLFHEYRYWDNLAISTRRIGP